METTEVLTAFGPAGLAVIPVLMLWWQLLSSNRLERKRVEVEYLRKALEVLHLPTTGLLKVLGAADDVAVKRHSSEMHGAEIVGHLQRLAREWDEVVHQHRDSLSVAQAFAVEQREMDLANCLGETMSAANGLGEVVGQAMQRATADPPQLSSVGSSFADIPQVSAYLKFSVMASQRIVGRIRALYG